MEKTSRIGDLIFRDESYQIRNCIYSVNRKLGSGFLEAVYQEALGIEFVKAGIPFEAKKQIQIMYDGAPLKQKYEADFSCYDKIIVELKAVREIHPAHKAQLLYYLTATGYRLGLLVNFHASPKAHIIRIVR
jgi:GxxExxY protein